MGYLALHIEAGRHGTTDLGGLNACFLIDAPAVMVSGGWTQALYLDARASDAQRRALEMILTGRAGGPWGILAQFVSRRLPTRFERMDFVDEGRRKALRIERTLEAVLEAVRGLTGGARWRSRT